MNTQPARIRTAAACGAILGLVLFVRGAADSGGGARLVAELMTTLIGTGPLLGLFGSAAVLGAGEQALVAGAFPGSLWRLFAGAVVMAVALGTFAATLRASESREPSDAPSESLIPPPKLAKYRGVSWRTFAAYGLGLLVAQLAVVVTVIAMLARRESGDGWSPSAVLLTALGVGTLCAFASGALGASWARRLAAPEATLAVVYLGLPLPVLLTLIHHVPSLMLRWGPVLKDVVYLSSLLGDSRPEAGYWLVFGLLLLAMFFGMNAGFVATSSGRLDLGLSYELFISRRHVAVFRPRLIGGVFSVLILGIVPPLLISAVISAVQRTVQRMRLRAVALVNPLAAAQLLDQLKKRAATPTETMTALSVGGVGVGVMALIIVLSVMSGFEEDLQKKILGTNAHGVVLKYSESMSEYPDVMAKVAKVRGVVGMTPFILNEVMISAQGNISGALIKGIDPATVAQVTELPTYIKEGGQLQWLETPADIRRGRPQADAVRLFDDKDSRNQARDENAEPYGREQIDRANGERDSQMAVDPQEKPATADGPSPSERATAAGATATPTLGKTGAQPSAGEDPFPPAGSSPGDVVLPGILLGSEMANSLRVVVGDRINVVSPMGGDVGPAGPMPKSRPFRVAGIFYSGMYEYDSKFVYIHLKEAQRFFGVNGAAGVEVKLADVNNARRVMRAIYDELDGYPYRTKDWGDMNRNLFAALRLEKLVMAIILSMIVVVAAGLIVATVIMLVLEKRKEIAVLKSLGVPDGGIVKIFLLEGLHIGVVGSVLGLIAGLAWCVVIERVGIRLDPQVYYIPSLPVKVEPLQTVLAVVIAVLVTFLASIYPALKAAEVEPVEGLKAE